MCVYIYIYIYIYICIEREREGEIGPVGPGTTMIISASGISEDGSAISMAADPYYYHDY